jgi:hypothetical protein
MVLCLEPLEPWMLDRKPMSSSMEIFNKMRLASLGMICAHALTA